MKGDRLEGSLEDNVLTALCWHEGLANELVTRLTPDMFSTPQYRRLAELAFKHIQKYGTPPQVHLRDYLDDLLRRGSHEAKIVKFALDQMDLLKGPLQVQYVREELDQFIESRQLAMAVDAASDALTAGNLQAARDALHVYNASHKTSPGIWLHQPDKVLGFLDQREDEFFPSGIAYLDKVNIRPARKEITLFIAPKGSGKTWYLVEVGKQSLLHRKTVLHITLELSEEQTAQRYVQALYSLTSRESKNINVRRFRKDKAGHLLGFHDDEMLRQSIAERKSDVVKRLKTLGRRPRLLIKEFPTSTLTIPQLSAYLDHLKTAEHFEPDVLIIDYAQLMHIDLANYRISTGMMFRQLRGLCVQRNMAGITAAQGGRQTARAKTVYSDDIAEDWSMIGTADTVLTYSRTQKEFECGLARVMVAHARADTDRFMVMLSQSYASGQFCIDSVYMNKVADAEVSRLNGKADNSADD